METSQSSQIILNKQKPPIAKKPLIILTPKRSLTKDGHKVSSTVASRRRCQSLRDDLSSENNNKARLSDLMISSNMHHLESVKCNNNQEGVQNEDMSSSRDELLCEENDFCNSNRDSRQEESDPEQTNDSLHENDLRVSLELIDEISSKVDVHDISKCLMDSTTTDEHNDSTGSEIENISKQNTTENLKELDIYHVHQQHVIEHSNEDFTFSESSGNIPSSIPDILSDHVLPKSIPTNPINKSGDPFISLGPNIDEEDAINSNRDTDMTGENNEDIMRNPDNDDGVDELVDLTSRRAILRGHSIRLSRHHLSRHPSRLPNIADSSSPLQNIVPPSSAPEAKDQLRNRLPKGWESRVDIHDRVFYIDHTNRTTTWKKPEAPPIFTERNSIITEEDRMLMDKRYQSLSRSLRSGHVSNHESGNYTGSQIKNISSDQSATDHREQPTHGNHGYQSRLDEEGEPVLSGAMFLCRPDFFTLLQNNQVASKEYDKSSSLKHMVNKIRRDCSSFKELQHRKDLVAFVNYFAEPNRPFPNNWEMKQDRSNKCYYIDHNLKVTTYIDPRLPPLPHFHADILRTFNRSSILSAQETSEGHEEYHDRVVSFLRQANILDVLKSKYPAILSSMSLKNKVNSVRSEGQQAVLKLKNDLELTVMLSVFEDEIMNFVAPEGTPDLQFGGSKHHLQSHHRSPQKKRNLDLKLNEFYAKLDDRGFCKGNVKYRLIVKRDRILQDGYDKIMSLTKKELQRSKLVIAFKGEDGLDYGGPSREFFFLISRELFNPYYGLFAYSANDTYTVHVSPTSSHIDNHLGWFRFAGRIIALALIHQYLLDVFFTRVFYKQLLNLKPCLSDLESLDLEFYRSLAWINDKATADELESMGLTFSVTEEVEDDEESADEADLKREGRKGLLRWFDGIVKGRSYLDYERGRSKSSPRNPLAAMSVLNVNSELYGDYNGNLLSSPRRVSAHVHNSSETSPSALGSHSHPNLVTSSSQSTECLSSVGEALPRKHHIPRIVERDLKPNGKSISVTERNKKDYLDRMISWRVKRGTHKQMEALIHGFNEILEQKLISRFDAHELELVIAGSVEIDVQDWRMNTVYRSGYTDNHQVITWFWNVVTSYDNDQRLRLLQFVTGTSSIPVEGFAALRGNTGPKRFCIEKWGRVTDLPRAHTCFNRLDLPPYTSYDILLEKLTIAVEETSTFGIE